MAGKKITRVETIDTLAAISPLDGRYRDKIEALAQFASEMALIKARIEVEAKARLKALTPETYIGKAVELTNEALTEIVVSRWAAHVRRQ